MDFDEGPPCSSIDVPKVGTTEAAWGISCDRPTTASVGTADLDGDGTADVVTGIADSNGYGGAVAVDGKDGSIRWQVSLDAPVITAPVFMDVNGDDLPDVIVGSYDEKRPGQPEPEIARPGRGGPLVALNGKSGATLWQIEPGDPAWQNFYTPQVVEDLDGDDISDLIVTSGGDGAKPVDQLPTIPGRVLAVSGASGSVIASLAAPDGQETYNSPLVLRKDHPDETQIVFGTGGEALPGSLWTLSLQNLLDEDRTGLTKFDLPETAGSFVAPAVAVEGDDSSTIIAISGDGSINAVDPVTGDIRWHSGLSTLTEAAGIDPPEVVAAWPVPAIGPVSGTGATDLVVQFSLTTIENLHSSIGYIGGMLLAVMDAKTGEVSSTLVVDNADSVASPILLNDEATGEAVVLCACVAPADPSYLDPVGRHASSWGLWRPATGEVTSLTWNASAASTPVVMESDDGPIAYVAIGKPPPEFGLGVLGLPLNQALKDSGLSGKAGLTWPQYLGAGGTGVYSSDDPGGD